MFNVRLAGGHLYGKQLFTWLSLVVSFMASFVLSFFPLDVLVGIWDLIESVSEGFFTYSCLLSKTVPLLWFLYVTYYVCVYMIFSNMVNRITVVHYASCFVLYLTHSLAFFLSHSLTGLLAFQDGTFAVVSLCYILCLCVYDLQQYGQSNNSCPLCFLFCSVL